MTSISIGTNKPLLTRTSAPLMPEQSFDLPGNRNTSVATSTDIMTEDEASTRPDKEQQSNPVDYIITIESSSDPSKKMVLYASRFADKRDLIDGIIKKAIELDPEGAKSAGFTLMSNSAPNSAKPFVKGGYGTPKLTTHLAPPSTDKIVDGIRDAVNSGGSKPVSPFKSYSANTVSSYVKPEFNKRSPQLDDAVKAKSDDDDVTDEV